MCPGRGELNRVASFPPEKSGVFGLGCGFAQFFVHHSMADAGGGELDPTVERLRLCVEQGRKIHAEEGGGFRLDDDSVIPKVRDARWYCEKTCDLVGTIGCVGCDLADRANLHMRVGMKRRRWRRQPAAAAAAASVGCVDSCVR